MKKHFILMGDIIDSRKINEEQLWIDLNDVINNAKEEFNESILSSLEIKIGDEFQVIMKDINSLLSLLLYLDIYFRYKKINCRFAIGFGDVTGDINYKSAYNMLGMGLTNTNELLNNKKEKYSFFIQDDIYKTILLNTIGILLEDVLSNLTTKQILFLFYKIIQKSNMDELELKMETGQRNLYNYFERSKYNLIKIIFGQISSIFVFDEESLKRKYFNEFKINIGK
jgi:hypothetical protein